MVINSINSICMGMKTTLRYLIRAYEARVTQAFQILLASDE